MAGFPLLTDNHGRQQIVEGLRVRDWDVVRAIDIFREGTDDEVLFEYASKQGRVFVSSDEPAQEIPKRWLGDGRVFHGMVCWPLGGSVTIKIEQHERAVAGRRARLRKAG